MSTSIANNTLGHYYKYSDVLDFLCQMELPGVKEWQEELFAPNGVKASIEDSHLTTSKSFINDFVEDLIARQPEWFVDIEKDGHAKFENLFIHENGRRTCILERLLLKPEKNPLFTNMELEENVPQAPTYTYPGVIGNSSHAESKPRAKSTEVSKSAEKTH